MILPQERARGCRCSRPLGGPRAGGASSEPALADRRPRRGERPGPTPHRCREDVRGPPVLAPDAIISAKGASLCQVEREAMKGMKHVRRPGHAGRLGAIDRRNESTRGKNEGASSGLGRRGRKAAEPPCYFATPWFFGATGTSSNMLPSPRVRMPVLLAIARRFSVVHV